MQPTDVLSSEHRVIEQVLNCLEEMAERCATEGKLDGVAAGQALDFFQNFADRCHHCKEEKYLFPLLEAKGFSRQHGPTGVMLAEHDDGRRHVRAMAATVAGAAGGDVGAARQFVIHARAYVRLLREHIAKEDQCLFPMAEATLTNEDERALLAAFDRVEDQDLHAGTHEKYLHLADELAERFDVPRVRPDSEAGHGCGACGHHVATVLPAGDGKREGQKIKPLKDGEVREFSFQVKK